MIPVILTGEAASRFKKVWYTLSRCAILLENSCSRRFSTSVKKQIRDSLKKASRCLP